MMARTLSIVPAFAMAALLAAVSAPSAPAGTHLQGAIPVFDVREELRIASDSSVPGMLLTNVEELAVLPDGRMVTSHPRESILRVFDASGRLLKVIGRRGDGPADFRLLHQVGYVGDRIWAEDIGSRRYKIFDARTYELVGTVAQGATGGGFFGLASDSTSFYATLGDSSRFSIKDRAGRPRVNVGLLPRRAGHRIEVQMREITPGGMRTGKIVPHTMYSPLSTRTQVQLAPGGQVAFALEVSELWNGPPGQFTIRRIDTATGRISAPVTVSLPVRRVTSSQADSLVNRLTPLIRSVAASDPRLVDQYREKARVPATFPAVEYFRPSADGVLWLAEYGLADTRLVVDTTGKPLMRVRLPNGLRVVAVSRTHVWGVTLDADDLPIIGRYRIQQR